MKTRMTLPLAVIAAGLCGLSQAVPTISLDRVQQRYPYSNCVDVDYTIAGMDNVDPLGYSVELQVTAQVGGEELSMTASNFLQLAWCDLPTSNGTWRVTWDATADGADFICASATFSARLVYDPVPLEEATYLIVNLSGGKDAASYPSRYVRGEAPSRQSFNHDVYKTDKLVLRRIKACTFPFGANKTATTIENDYFFSVFPVTQRQYQLVAGTNPSKFKDDDGDDLAMLRPVETLTLATATQNFHDKLSSKVTVLGSGVTAFGHPTSEQWECACRAGTSTTYYWGSSGDPYLDYGWFAKNSGGHTRAVGGKLPNAWGIFDMVGNASDWTTTPSGAHWVYRGANYTTTQASDAASTTSSIWPTYSSKDCISVRVIQNLVADPSQAASSVTPVEMAVSSFPNVKADLRAAPVRTVATLDELFPLAMNSSAAWAAGGASDGTSFVRVSAMAGSDAADSSTWLAYSTTDRAPVAGEGSDTWVPAVKGLFRVERILDGMVAGVGYFDMNETTELADRLSISSAVVTLSPSEIPYTGVARTLSSVSVSLTGWQLVEGRDFLLTYADNVFLGSATVFINGIGDYAGQIKRNYKIVPNLGEAVSQQEVASPLDLRLAAVRKIDTLGHLFPFAMNSSPDWVAGGDPLQTSFAHIIEMSGSHFDDPTTWEPGDMRVREAVPGEGLDSGWVPGVRGLYRIELVRGDAVVESGHFDMTETQGVPDKPSIADAEITVPDVAAFESSGAKLKGVSVVYGGRTLIEGIDYTLTYESNTVLGTATAYVTGLGTFSGQVTHQFEVVPATGEDMAEAEESGNLEITTNRLLVCNLSKSPVFTWNTCETFPTNFPSVWKIGGLPKSANALATFSLAPMADVDSAPDESCRMVLDVLPGGGVRKIRHVAAGLYQAKLTVSVDGVQLPGELTRVLRISGGGLMVILR